MKQPRSQGPLSSSLFLSQEGRERTLGTREHNTLIGEVGNTGREEPFYTKMVFMLRHGRHVGGRKQKICTGPQMIPVLDRK